MWCACFAAVSLVLGCGSLPEISSHDGEAGGSPIAGSSGAFGAGGGPAFEFGGTGGTVHSAACGNGQLETGELCDDGNNRDGDGCAADCATQSADYDCSKVGELCVDQVVCGNGRLEGSEVCDDGNDSSGDGCTLDCAVIEAGFGCPRPGKPCVTLAICGNGLREKGEQCDDGQMPPTGGDGCSASCAVESGFFCPKPDVACIKVRCGDGVRTPDEECDDGKSPPLSGDGCSNTCKVESGFHCSATTCSSICGDGLLRSNEACDDGGRISGDGCSAVCAVEPFTKCSGEPSLCQSTIQCGNGIREPGEICDPPGVDGCLPGCASFSPDVGGGATCGNSVLEASEGCDPPMPGKGCTLGCTVESNWSCPFPGFCFAKPRCGDGIVNALLGEACDDGNSLANDGCNGCAVEPTWSCAGLGPSVCTHEICGNGVRTPSEQCDDGNQVSTDGCASCTVSAGWVCPTPGKPCSPRCGDGLLVGNEACDDANTASGDGCNAGCRVEPGFVCGQVGVACKASKCGNGSKEPGEGCDYGDQIAGDGCGPTCQLEPVITPGPNPAVQVFCGDGLVTGVEQCDDGNTSSGDGCSDKCKTEAGFTCKGLLTLPSSLDMQVTYRDFKSGNAIAGGGNPDFQYKFLEHVAGITGAPCTTKNQATCGKLDADGKPNLVVDNQATTGIRGSDTFGLWYRNANTANVKYGGKTIVVAPFTRTLTLTQSPPQSGNYVFDSNALFPLDDVGWGPIGTEVPLCAGGVTNTTGFPPCDTDCGTVACRAHNFGFTTELRYFFQYQGGETLSFIGDDDVWVYINGKLAVDIGGLHEALAGRVVLGDDGSPSGTDSDCSVHSQKALPAVGTCYTSAEQADKADGRFGLTKGEVYEIVLFHAERHSADSHFKLTLSGFLAPRSYCSPACGDGVLVSGEVCDNGANNADGISGACNTTCTALAFCGDSVLQSGEACDKGTQNLDLYSAGSVTGKCAPGCMVPPHCGDGSVQPAYEQCDNGASNNDASYGSTSCTTACHFGGYCGDGQKNGPEACDVGAMNGTTYGLGSCGYDCKAGPRCGDGVRNGPEECDGSVNCDATCHLLPFCGDGVKSAGEACDFGQFAADDYGSCRLDCSWGPKCGDANKDSPYEECDLGSASNTGAYGGCSAACTFGPNCGDGVRQASNGEACDNGSNDDTYAFDAGACGPACTIVPRCGDGILAATYELCDEGAANDDARYDGCTTRCEFGPYCGDGKRDPQEACDLGSANRAYAADKNGCGYDCQPAPYCGDGERNGPEQCDLGSKKNTGAYGTCNANCTLGRRCGDKIVQAGEGCDDGPTGSLTCSGMCEVRGVK